MSAKRCWLLLLAAACLILLSGCASAPRDKGWYTPPVELLRAAEPPPCAFEDPYLPEPCTIEVAPGERLVVRNAAPEGRGPQGAKRHGWLWWLLLSLVTF